MPGDLDRPVADFILDLPILTYKPVVKRQTPLQKLTRSTGGFHYSCHIIWWLPAIPFFFAFQCLVFAFHPSKVSHF